MTELLPTIESIAHSVVEELRLHDDNYGDAYYANLVAALKEATARPARSADAVGTRQLMVDLVNAMSAKMLLQSGEVRAWDNRAMPLLEAFRQQTWAEAIEAAAAFIETHDFSGEHDAIIEGNGKLKYINVHWAAAIRALTPLERKEG